MGYSATVYIAEDKAGIPAYMHPLIVDICSKSIAARGLFVIALSGGSLPSMLSTLPKAFETARVDPQYDKWHVILADERCVPLSSDDSNMKALKAEMLSKMSIPDEQVHAIDQRLLQSSSGAADDSLGKTAVAAIAASYQAVVTKVLEKAAGMLDLALLGFGPDGHTCSLFPSHPLLHQKIEWVSPITDSPKPPPNRITLTFPVLNEFTRHVIFTGAGDSKRPIVQSVLQKTPIDVTDSEPFVTDLVDPAPYPCAMVRPKPTKVEMPSDKPALIWIVDRAAAISP